MPCIFSSSSSTLLSLYLCKICHHCCKWALLQTLSNHVIHQAKETGVNKWSAWCQISARLLTKIPDNDVTVKLEHLALVYLSLTLNVRLSDGIEVVNMDIALLLALRMLLQEYIDLLIFLFNVTVGKSLPGWGHLQFKTLS